MIAITVAGELTTSVFQLAVADHSWRIVETHRLTRTQFARWFDRPVHVWESNTSHACWLKRTRRSRSNGSAARYGCSISMRYPAGS